MSRTKNAFKMICGSILNQLMVVISGLILPPLIIQNYGSATNGLVNSVKQILNYFTIATVGLGAAGQIALYEPLAQHDNNKINKIMTELSNFLNKLSYFFALFVGILAFVLPIIRKGELDFFTIFFIVLICGIGSLIEFCCLQKYKILLQADQKQYISSSINSQGILVNLILSFILIELNAPIIAVQLIATLAYVIRMLLMTYRVKKIYPFLNLHEKTTVKQIPKQKEALLYKVSDIILNYAPMTLVTFLFSFNDSSIYSIYNTVFSSIVMIVSIFSSGFASSFGNLLVEGKLEKLKQSFDGYNFIYRTMLFWVYTCSAILIIPFISVYIKNNDGINYIIPMLGILFALNGLFRNIRIPYTTIIDSVGDYNKENIVLNYIEVIMNIALTILFAIIFGLTGILVGGAISSIIRSIIYVYSVNKRNIKRSFIKDFVLLILNFIVSIILVVCLNNIVVNNFMEWIFNAIRIAFINSIVFLIINVILDNKSFREFMIRIKYLFKKKEA